MFNIFISKDNIPSFQLYARLSEVKLPDLTLFRSGPLPKIPYENDSVCKVCLAFRFNLETSVMIEFDLN